MRNSILLLITIVGILSALWAQNPSQRPEILWMMGAPNNYTIYYNYMVSLTDDQHYVLVSDGVTQLAYRREWLLSPPSTNYALATFNQGSFGAFSSPSETSQEYIWTVNGGSVDVNRFVRQQGTFGGAFIEGRSFRVNLSGVNAVLPLRYHRTSNSSRNRLAVAGHGANLSLIRLTDTGTEITFERVQVIAHAGSVNFAAYDPETELLVSCGEDGLIRVWTVQTTPSLALVPIRTIVNGFGSVYTVGLVNSSQGKLLISTSQFGIVTARRWNDGNPASQPLWQTALETGLYDRGTTYYEEQHPHFYGQYRGLLLIGSRGSGYNTGYLLDPDTGRSVYEVPLLAAAMRQGFNPLWAHQTSFNLGIASASYLPLLYWGVYLADFVPHRFLGFSSLSVVSAQNDAVTALLAERLQLNNYRLTAGFSSGAIRVYQGPSFNTLAQNTTTFAGQRIVRLRQIGSDLFAFGSNGTIHRLDPTTLSSTASVDAEQEIADADAIVLPNNTVRIAVIGQTDSGAPRVRIYSYASGSFSAQGNIDPGGTQAVGVRFLNTPTTLITAATGVLRRFNLTSSGWTQAWTVTPEAITGVEVNSANEIILKSNSTGTPRVIRSSDGGELRAAIDSSILRVSALSPSSYVWGLAQFTPWGDVAHRVCIGTRDCGRWSIDLVAFLSDEPLAIASLADEDLHYVGCADGSVWQVVLPAPQTRRLYDYNRLASEFGIDEVMRTVIGFVPNPQYRNFSSFCGQLDAARISEQNGTVLNQNTILTGGSSADTIALSATKRVQSYWWVIAGSSLTAYPDNGNPLSWNVSNMQDIDVAPANGSAFVVSQRTITYNNSSLKIPTVSIHIPGSSTETFDAWWNPVNNIPVHGRTTSGFLAAIAVNSDGSRVAVLANSYVDGTPNISVWRRVQNGWQLERVLERGTNWEFSTGNVSATLIDFHPTRPNLLYVGFSNGVLGLYDLDSSNPTSRVRSYQSDPSVGAVGAMDIGEFSLGGVSHTVMAFVGPNGMSVWVANACRLDCLSQTAYYSIDVGQSGGSISLNQPVPGGGVLASYGDSTKHVLAKVATPLPDYCPADTNNDGVVDDADLLVVLFEFGATGNSPGDVNCDRTVDDADLLIVLFAFGSECSRCSGG